MRRTTLAAGAAMLLLAASVHTAVAQEHSGQDHQDMGMVGDSMAAGKHLKLTPHWPEQPGDRARADSLVTVARQALTGYADVDAAERDGYGKKGKGEKEGKGGKRGERGKGKGERGKGKGES